MSNAKLFLSAWVCLLVTSVFSNTAAAPSSPNNQEKRLDQFFGARSAMVRGQGTAHNEAGGRP